jgi:hypothetical protein
MYALEGWSMKLIRGKQKVCSAGSKKSSSVYLPFSPHITIWSNFSQSKGTWRIFEELRGFSSKKV